MYNRNSTITITIFIFLYIFLLLKRVYIFLIPSAYTDIFLQISSFSMISSFLKNFIVKCAVQFNL